MLIFVASINFNVCFLVSRLQTCWLKNINEYSLTKQCAF